MVGDDQTIDDISQLPKAVVRDDIDGKGRSVATTLSSLARKSWMRSSRSPSPSKRKSIDAGSRGHIGGASGPNTPPETKTPPDLDETHPVPNGPVVTSGNVSIVQRKSTTGNKAGRRPISAMLGRSQSYFHDNPPAVPSLPKSFSTDKLSSFAAGQASISREHLPRLPSTDRLQNSGTETPKKKDELWSNFRNLDGEFHK